MGQRKEGRDEGGRKGGRREGGKERRKKEGKEGISPPFFVVFAGEAESTKLTVFFCNEVLKHSKEFYTQVGLEILQCFRTHVEF
jgi:hypothetical protein